uniref:Transcription factor n=1 Tax=Angiostrongylus cantonensis TaxID=6313 RepID=A0A0K0D5G0_ANGCA
MGNALLDSMRPQNLYGLQPNVLNPRPLQFQPFSGNPLIGGDTNPFLLNGVLNSMLPALWEIPQNVNNNPLWATGLQNSPAADAFLNRPGGTAFGNIPLPNSSQQDNGVLQNPATLPTFPDNRVSLPATIETVFVMNSYVYVTVKQKRLVMQSVRSKGIHPFLERHSEEFPLTNTVVQTLPATALVHPSDGGNEGIPIPITSGDFPAGSNIGRNGHDIAQNQPGPSAMSTTATQTEPFDHFNPLLPVVPTNGNSRRRNDRGEVYVNHADDGSATTFVDVEGSPVSAFCL